MTPIEPGDVLLVPFPYTDQSAVKQRPAVVLSSKAYNLTHPDLILAPITGRFGGNDETTLTAWQQAGLAKPSAVKPLLASFEASLVRRKLGRLEPKDLAAAPPGLLSDKDLRRRALLRRRAEHRPRHSRRAVPQRPAGPEEIR